MRQKPITFYCILFSTIILVGCAEHKSSVNETDVPDASTFDLVEARKLIEEKTVKFTEAHILRDTAFLNNIVTEDARSFPPNSEIVTGRKAIAQLNFEWVNYGIHEFEEETTLFYGNEDYLIDEGTYYLSYGADSIADRGKYINIWKKENGDWKIYSNIWNTSMPLVVDE